MTQVTIYALTISENDTCDICKKTLLHTF